MKFIPLTQGYSAIVDDDDFNALSQYRWKILKASGKLYACRSSPLAGQKSKSGGRKYKTFLMHREVISAKDGLFVDHINNNGLDNRKSNLRECNQSQNLHNMVPREHTSKYKGVSWNKEKKKWVAQYSFMGSRTHLGYFTTEEIAMEAYENACKKLRGEFHRSELPGLDMTNDELESWRKANPGLPIDK